MTVRATLGCILLSLAMGAWAADAPAPGRAASDSIDAITGTSVPASALARDAARITRDAEGDLLFQHSMRVYYWAAIAAQRRGLAVDPELLYVAAMFHDYGLTTPYGQSHLRYEVDGANAARQFLRDHGRSQADAQRVWLAIALHTTNGVSRHVEPLAELLADGANMDLVGLGYGDFTSAQRSAVEAAYPRSPEFAEDFLQALYDSLKHRPETTQGTGLADVLAYKDPGFRRRDFSALMRRSPWADAK